MSLRALTVVSLLTIVPGMGAGLALWKPGEVGLATRLGMAIGFGYALVGSISFLLAVVHQLSPVPLFVLLAAVTGVLWYLAFRRASLREHLSAIASEVRNDPWSIALGLVVLIAIAVIRLGYTSQIFVQKSGFRYWADGLEVADSSGIPSSAVHYGAIHPPTTSKVVLNSFNAAMSMTIGRDPIRTLPPLLWLVSVGFAGALWSLGRELGLRRMAPLLPVLLVMNRTVLNEELTQDMAAYRAETVGRLIAFSALVLAVRAIRQGSAVREGVVAGLLFAVAAGTHFVPLVVTLATLASYALAVALQRRDNLRHIVRRGAVLAAVAASAGFLVLALPRGEIGFGGAFRGADYDGFRQIEGFDPTFYLLHGDLKRARTPPPREISYYPPGYLFRVFMSESVPTKPPGPRYVFGTAREGLHSMTLSILIALVGLGLAVAVFLWLPSELRPLGPTALGLGVFLFAVILLFSFRYEVYLLARFGLRRMQDYGSFPFVLLALTMIEAGLGFLKRISPLIIEIGAVVIVVLTAALILPSGRADQRDAERGELVVKTLRSIRRNIPCESRILVSARTSGTFESSTGHVAILEGMAPYLRPDLLREAVTLLRSTRAFFQHPEENRRFLERQGVDFVVVVERRVDIGFLTYDLNASATRLARVPFLRRSDRAPEITVFRVTGLRRNGSFPISVGRPGYGCPGSSSASEAT